MVTRALLVIAALASVARAEYIAVSPEPERTEWSRLGTRIGYGAVPVGDTLLMTGGIGVMLDQPLVGRWRWTGEYEYLWMGDGSGFQDEGVAALPDSGHRVQIGVRRRLAEHIWRGVLGVYLDGDAGVGAMLVDHQPRGSIAQPDAFLGVHAGFTVSNREQIWEYDIVVRGLAVPDGAGVLFGIGLVWGQ